MNMNDGVEHEKEFRCLIVEDNINLAEIMTIFFERNGIVSDTAENGQQGLKIYLDNQSGYDVIFLDLQMPVMDGYELARLIRESGSMVSIVAMSGTYAGVAENGGFNFFLKKPFEMRRLAEIINEVKEMDEPDKPCW